MIKKLLKIEPSQNDVLATFKYNYIDKVRLEYAKTLIAQQNYEEAKSELLMIVQKINADWRSCYRAFFLLWKLAHKGIDIDEERYKQLCLTCNPNFPLSLFKQEENIT